MQIITYTNTAEVVRLDKSNYLSNRQEMDIPERFISGQDVKAPVITISSSTIPTFNYVHIPTFGRYYFAGAPIWEGSNLWSIPLVTDLLYSFKDKILNLHGVASRLEDQAKHSMIIDDRITAEATQYEDMEFIEMVKSKPASLVFDIQDSENLQDKIIFSAFSGERRYFEPVVIDSVTAIDGNGNEIALTRDGNTYRGNTPTVDGNIIRVTARYANKVQSILYGQYYALSKSGDTYNTLPIPVTSTTNIPISVIGYTTEDINIFLSIV